MNTKLIPYVKCLRCGCAGPQLRLFDTPAQPPGGSQTPAPTTGRSDGVLLCKCGGFYLIIGDIVRTVRTESALYADYLARYREALTSLGIGSELPTPSRKIRHAHDSFTFQWNMLRKHQDIWGMSREDMYRNLEKQLALSRSEMRSLTILDAGCGH
ncbi:unnamed protein product, partial [marine sediment metagenome]